MDRGLHLGPPRHATQTLKQKSLQILLRTGTKAALRTYMGRIHIFEL